MHRIKVSDMDKDLEGEKTIFVEIDDALLEIGLRKGLIDEDRDGYYFVGDYEELIAFKSRKPDKKFKLLD